MSVSDGHYNPKGVLSSFAEFSRLATNWTQFGHVAATGATFGFARAGPETTFGFTNAEPAGASRLDLGPDHCGTNVCF